MPSMGLSGGTVTISGPVTITAGSLPLPTGAATEATLATLATPKFFSRQDTFTGTGVGATLNATLAPCNAFSIQVLSVGGLATAWVITLEGSLDNVTFTTLLTHVTVTGDGVILSSGAALTPVKYFRSRVFSVTLAPATSLTVNILGTA